MSLNKQISTYPSTGRGFSVNHNFIHSCRGAYLTKKDFTFTDEDIKDEDYFFEQFEAGNIFPLHQVQEIENQNEDIEKIESIQGFTFKGSKGLISHILRFEWDLTFHQIIETYSGTDLNIIYYDGNKHLIYTVDQDSGLNRGFKTNRLILENFNPISDGSAPVLSGLDIEWFDPDEINLYGQSTKINWMPSIIDKWFLKITITSIGVNYINFTAKYISNDVTTLTSSDVTITDDFNGLISGVVVAYSGGVYKANNFNKNISNGCLQINSSAYLGKQRYRAVTTITYKVGFDLMDGDGFDLLNII